ncbi:qhypothetical protein [Blastocystis sp. subtype 4]|uniref:qhypothetical protein n=1 Tax=Blastocystis sp. subtype 4 TaxID=944170 RepID=UPI0007114BF1|nr:qhypothetical protein [Blastocystis sp. subtype 4]KNB45910.1 qhypothetical protein [Blastocystis sp. subtype 4]|eukprot:XP_014529353.1 qhypothetical protein [Blastocystis sp. subtype 4]
MEQVNAYYAIVYIPWSFKLFFGYISDSLPIFKHKRVPYFVFYSFLVAVVFCLYGFIVRSYKTALIMGTILNACQCGAQLMVDTLVVERVHKETDDEGRGQSLAMASKTAGTVVATILSLILMLPSINCSFKIMFCLSGLPYLLASIVALKVEDRVVTRMVIQIPASFKDTLVEGVKLIFCGQRSNSILSKNRPLFPLLLFLFIRSMLPTATNNIYGFLAATVSVENWQYNTLNISTSIFSLIASLIYSRYLVGKNLALVILGTTIAACITGILQIYFVTGLFEGMTLFWVSIVLMDINSFASQLSFTPMLVMVAKACPVGYESSMWSVFFSLNDLAGTVSGSLSVYLTTHYGISYEDYSNLYKMVVTCSFLTLLPLVYLFFIRDYFSMVATMQDTTAQVRGEYE